MEEDWVFELSYNEGGVAAGSWGALVGVQGAKLLKNLRLFISGGFIIA